MGRGPFDMSHFLGFTMGRVRGCADTQSCGYDPSDLGFLYVRNGDDAWQIVMTQ